MWHTCDRGIAYIAETNEKFVTVCRPLSTQIEAVGIYICTMIQTASRDCFTCLWILLCNNGTNPASSLLHAQQPRPSSATSIPAWRKPEGMCSRSRHESTPSASGASSRFNDDWYVEPSAAVLEKAFHFLDPLNCRKWWK